MRYVNDVNPNIKILVKRGPEVEKGQNANFRLDQFVEFRFGMCETDDPEAIAVLDARPDCRREGVMKPVAGYFREEDIETEVQRRLELARANVAAVAEKPKLTGKDLPDMTCAQCGKVIRGRLGYLAHLRGHKKKAASAAA